MAQPQGGFVFRIDQMSGRFLPVPNGSVGDGCCVVTGCSDIQGVNAAYVALNAGAAVPMPAAGKWTVDYTALTNAIAGGIRATLTPWTY